MIHCTVGNAGSIVSSRGSLDQLPPYLELGVFILRICLFSKMKETELGLVHAFFSVLVRLRTIRKTGDFVQCTRSTSRYYANKQTSTIVLHM